MHNTLPRLGFIGSGKMATALIRGLLEAKQIAAECLMASDPLPEARLALAQATGIAVVADNRAVAEASEILVLAVKPQTMGAVLAELQPVVTPRHLVISIAAGVPLRRLTQALGVDRRIIRVMPNTPCLVGAGASAYALGAAATADDARLIERILSAVGKAYGVPESLLDAVTGLSGSGPAFVAMVIEALSDGGVRMGLPREVATALAAQTVLGTGRMVLEMKLHPGLIKDMVASPGGTTIAGVHALERAGLRGALIDAVEAATRRSVELGQAEA
jgi:pyrroline-5-carboxylate reductase